MSGSPLLMQVSVGSVQRKVPRTPQKLLSSALNHLLLKLDQHLSLPTTLNQSTRTAVSSPWHIDINTDATFQNSLPFISFIGFERKMEETQKQRERLSLAKRVRQS